MAARGQPDGGKMFCTGDTVKSAQRKVLFVNRFYAPDQSATGQILTDLATSLAKSGIEVHVLCSRQLAHNASEKLPRAESIEGVKIHRIWTTRFGRATLPLRTLDYISFYLSAIPALLVNLNKGDVVVFKTDPPMISVFGVVCAKLRGAKAINWLQDVFPEVALALGHGGRVRWFGAILTSLRDWSLRQANANVTIGRQMAERLIARGVKRETICIIPNWADGAAIKPVPPGANRLRQEWGFGSRLVVGYSGNMGRAHELDILIHCAEKLRGEIGIIFVLIGAGSQLAHLKSLVNEKMLQNVLFKPFQPRELLGLSLSVPDVHYVSLKPELEGLIVPSKFYGIIAAGRPTIYSGSEDGEIAKLLEKHQCGVSVSKSCAVEKICSQLCVWAQSRPQLQAMGENARLLFENEFERSNSEAKWREIIASVLGAVESVVDRAKQANQYSKR